MDDDFRTLTAKQVCDMLQISRARLREWLDDGMPHIVMKSGRVKFLACSVRQFAKDQETRSERN
jgi:predicted site-specific integrase-resolvase